MRLLFLVLLTFLYLPSAQADHLVPDNNTFMYPQRRGRSQRPTPQPPLKPLVYTCAKYLSSKECDVFILTNRVRLKNNLPALAPQRNCYDMAKEHSGYMVQLSNRGTLLAKALNHDYFKERVTKYRVSRRHAAENVAGGDFKSAEAVIDSWMSSSGHKKNILDPDVKYLGVGMMTDRRGKEFWTQCFAGN